VGSLEEEKGRGEESLGSEEGVDNVTSIVVVSTFLFGGDDVTFCDDDEGGVSLFCDTFGNE